MDALTKTDSFARHDRALWHECPGLRSASRELCKLSGLQPYRAGSYRGTWKSPGLPRKLYMTLPPPDVVHSHSSTRLS